MDEFAFYNGYRKEHIRDQINNKETELTDRQETNKCDRQVVRQATSRRVCMINRHADKRTIQRLLLP